MRNGNGEPSAALVPVDMIQPTPTESSQFLLSFSLSQSFLTGCIRWLFVHVSSLVWYVWLWRKKKWCPINSFSRSNIRWMKKVYYMLMHFRNSTHVKWPNARQFTFDSLYGQNSEYTHFDSAYTIYTQSHNHCCVHSIFNVNCDFCNRMSKRARS